MSDWIEWWMWPQVSCKDDLDHQHQSLNFPMHLCNYSFQKIMKSSILNTIDSNLKGFFIPIKPAISMRKAGAEKLLTESNRWRWCEIDSKLTTKQSPSSKVTKCCRNNSSTKLSWMAALSDFKYSPNKHLADTHTQTNLCLNELLFTSSIASWLQAYNFPAKYWQLSD